MPSSDPQKSLKEMARRVASAHSKRLQKPGAADVEVDGDDESGSWDDPAWDSDVKEAAVRGALDLYKEASGLLDLVVAVDGNELLGAMDGRRRGATDVRFWRAKVGDAFDLYVVRDVPMQVARKLVDFGSRRSRDSDGRRLWALAKRWSEPRPFKRVR